MIRFFALICLLFAAPTMAQTTIPLTIQTRTGDRHLSVELATTAEARRLGLSHRQHMGAADGMLFVFPAPAVYHFWMKNTYLPLDMLFMDAAHRIVFIATNATPHDLTPIGPKQRVQYVLEINGGRADRDGITVGDRVRYALPNNIVIH
jgi:uncharacterized membrane protein (UPF0127 family)